MRGSRLGGWCGGLAASQSLNQTNISWMHLGTDIGVFRGLGKYEDPKNSQENSGNFFSNFGDLKKSRDVFPNKKIHKISPIFVS